jgi:hypothetical protein
MNRRDFFQSSLLSTATLMALPGQLAAEPQPKVTGVTDTYVNLFEWPFRPLKYADTAKLTAKLAKHNVTEAWAGTYEALFYKDIDQANARLAEECKKKWPVKLLPVGTVNTTWPDWEEDLKRCSVKYGMTGIRIFPAYQMIRLDSPEFMTLLELATKMKMFVQIVGDVEDPRHNHPLITLKEGKYDPLLEATKKIPAARIQLTHWNRKVPNPLLQKIINQTEIKFDISRIEGAGELMVRTQKLSDTRRQVYVRIACPLLPIGVGPVQTL